MVLEIRGLSFSYRPGGPEVLRGLDLDLKEGECVAILGRNGAGKSTLCALLGGLSPEFYPGVLRGQLRRGHSPALLLQDVDSQLLSDSVRDELGFFLKYSTTARFSSVDEAGRGLRLGGLLGRKVYQLSSGEKQMVVLAGALACASGKLLVLDEPSAFLDAQSAGTLAVRLRELKAEGAGIVLCGHELQALAPLVDRWLLLDGGKLSPCAPRQEEYYGSFPATRAQAGETELLSSEGLFCRRDGRAVFENFSFQLKAGEVLGVCGSNGSGKTTLARILYGLDGDYSGRLSLFGKPASPKALRSAVRLVSSNPYHSLLYRTVEENLKAAVSCGSAPDAEDLLGRLGLADCLGRDIQQLSWGQAQKAQFACALSCGAEILVMDECLSAVDSAGVVACAGLMRGHCAGGGGILFISHVEALARSVCSDIIDMEGKSLVAH